MLMAADNTPPDLSDEERKELEAMRQFMAEVNRANLLRFLAEGEEDDE